DGFGGLHLALAFGDDGLQLLIADTLDLVRSEVTNVHLHRSGYFRVRRPIRSMAGLTNAIIGRLAGTGIRPHQHRRNERKSREQSNRLFHHFPPCRCQINSRAITLPAHLASKPKTLTASGAGSSMTI